MGGSSAAPNAAGRIATDAVHDPRPRLAKVRGGRDADGKKLIAGQLAFHQAIDEAGVLIDAMGFHPTAKAWRVLQRTTGPAR